MAKAKVYNLQGQETGSVVLDDKIFFQEAKPELIYQAVRVAMANQRQPIAHSKTRDEVHGGGRKPWRQKGTGRARHGSIRSPLWKGGGVTFGPRKETIKRLAIPSKMRDKALRAVLSERAKNNSLIVVEGLGAMDNPSSKLINNFFKTLKISL